MYDITGAEIWQKDVLTPDDVSHNSVIDRSTYTCCAKLCSTPWWIERTQMIKSDSRNKKNVKGNWWIFIRKKQKTNVIYIGNNSHEGSVKNVHIFKACIVYMFNPGMTSYRGVLY